MTIQRRLEIAGFILALLFLGIAGREAILAREARVRADATAAAKDLIIAEKATEIHQRDTAAATAANALQQQAASLQTPRQAAQVILRYLPAPAAAPGTPAASQTLPTVSRSELPASVVEELPGGAPSASYTLLTDAQLEATAKNELTCEADRKLLTACRADRVDQDAQLGAAQQKAAAFQAAAKGGTGWRRIGHDLKLLGCGVAGAYVGARFDKAGPGTGAAIGTAAGVSICAAI